MTKGRCTLGDVSYCGMNMSETKDQDFLPLLSHLCGHGSCAHQHGVCYAFQRRSSGSGKIRKHGRKWVDIWEGSENSVKTSLETTLNG